MKMGRFGERLLTSIFSAYKESTTPNC